MKRTYPFAASAANQQRKTRVGCSLHRSLESDRSRPRTPRFHPSYQAEIRHHHPPLKSLTRSPLRMAATVQRDCGNLGIVEKARTLQQSRAENDSSTGASLRRSNPLNIKIRAEPVGRSRTPKLPFVAARYRSARGPRTGICACVVAITLDRTLRTPWSD